MAPGSKKFPLIRERDGTYSASYGPFQLRSAYQPIFSQDADGKLTLEAVEGLVRPAASGKPSSPAALFKAVSQDDGPAVDRLCRELHVANMPSIGRPDLLLFLNLNPELLPTATAAEQEVAALAETAREAGISATQIVCEIVEKQARSQEAILALAASLKRNQFKVAIDDFGAEQSDIERVELIRPDIVKFDALWVQRFLESDAGLDLLRATVQQFHQERIFALFEGLEEFWQVEACAYIGVRYLQGYGLTRPELAPTTFNEKFPVQAAPAPAEPEIVSSAAFDTIQMLAPQREYRPSLARPGHLRQTAFGRRGL